jgi:Tfp pilus assembly protein PilN
MKAINLLPVDAKQSRAHRVDPLLVGSGAALALVVMLVAVLTFSATGSVSAKQDDLDRAKAELNSIPQPVTQAGTTSPQPDTQFLAERNQRLAALNAALNGQVAWDRVLRQFSLALPKDVWLSSLTLRSPLAGSAQAPTTGVPTTPSAGTGSTGVSIAGYTYSQEGVARLLVRLAAVPYLTNVQLQNSGTAKVGDRNVVQFTILAGLRTGSPAGGGA